MLPKPSSGSQEWRPLCTLLKTWRATSAESCFCRLKVRHLIARPSYFLCVSCTIRFQTCAHNQANRVRTCGARLRGTVRRAVGACTRVGGWQRTVREKDGSFEDLRHPLSARRTSGRAHTAAIRWHRGRNCQQAATNCRECSCQTLACSLCCCTQNSVPLAENGRCTGVITMWRLRRGRDLSRLA